MATDDPHHISNQEAIDLTTRWREAHPDDIRAGLFRKIALTNLLAKPNAAGIRIYMGQKADGKWTFVMVATDAKDKDIFTMTSGRAASEAEDTGGDDTEEDPMMCPPYCDCDSPLSDCPPPP